MFKTPVLFGIALFAIVGCARVSTTTTLAADGSYVRSSTYAIRKGSLGQQKEPSFHSLFTLPNPKGRTPWTQDEDKQEKHLTIVSKGVAGADPVGGVGLLFGDGSPILKSHALVKKMDDGKLEYDEIVDWVGPKKPLDSASSTQILSVIKQGLPERYRDDKKLSALATKLKRKMIQAFFGPPYPALVEAMASPDLAKMRIADAVSDIFAGDLREAFPDISDAEIRKEIAVLEKIDATNMNEVNMNDNNNGPSSQDDEGLTSLLFVLDCPGKVVETNGIQTKTGKVYWSLYAASAMYDKVDLHAIIDPR